MNETEILLKIRTYLGANYREGTDSIIVDIYEEMRSIASNTSNLKEDDKRLYPYIKNAVISKYIRLGTEGMNSSSEGSESYSYIDIEDKLRKDIIKAGLRRLP